MKKIIACLLLLGVLICWPHKAAATFPVYGPVAPEATAPVQIAEDTTPRDPTSGPLRVVTRVVQPFVVDKSDDPNNLCADSPVMPGQDNKQFCGYSQELLQILAQKMGRDIAPQALDKSADDVVRDLSGKNPAYDIAIGNMSITSAREEDVDFSVPLPITNSGIQIMTRAPQAQRAPFLHNTWAALTGRTAQQVYPFFGLILLLMLITATLIYIIEQRHRNSFLHNVPWNKGIAEAFWWILTTIFGQEEVHPKGLSSRIIAFMWIPFGVICVSLFTATVTASLTAQQIQNTISGVDDLRNKKVLTVTGSTSKHYLDDHDIRAEVVGTINAAYPKLEAGEFDALVYDAPALQYYADHQGKDKVMTIEFARGLTEIRRLDRELGPQFIPLEGPATRPDATSEPRASAQSPGQPETPQPFEAAQVEPRRFRIGKGSKVGMVLGSVTLAVQLGLDPLNIMPWHHTPPAPRTTHESSASPSSPPRPSSSETTAAWPYKVSKNASGANSYTDQKTSLEFPAGWSVYSSTEKEVMIRSPQGEYMIDIKRETTSMSLDDAVARLRKEIKGQDLQVAMGVDSAVLIYNQCVISNPFRQTQGPSSCVTYPHADFVQKSAAGYSVVAVTGPPGDTPAEVRNNTDITAIRKSLVAKS